MIKNDIFCFLECILYISTSILGIVANRSIQVLITFIGMHQSHMKQLSPLPLKCIIWVTFNRLLVGV